MICVYVLGQVIILIISAHLQLIEHGMEDYQMEDSLTMVVITSV